MSRMQVMQHWAVVLVGVGLSLAAGCGPKEPPFAKVTGTVTLDGGPLPPGGVESYVVFENPDGRAEMVAIGPDGKYSAKVPLGANKVRVDHSEGMIYPKEGRVGLPMPGKVLIPTKFTNARTSGLEFQAKPGDHVYDIDLKGEATK